MPDFPLLRETGRKMQDFEQLRIATRLDIGAWAPVQEWSTKEQLANKLQRTR